MKKKLVGVFLTMALVFAISLGFIPGLETAMTAHAADDSGTCTYCGNIEWKLEGTTMTISRVDGTGSGNMCDDCRSAWNDIDYVPIKEVVIEDGVTSIAYKAFFGFMSMTSITIPDEVTSIGENAFWRCDSLESVNIPKGMTSIGKCAFTGSGLKSVIIPEGVTSIGEEAFSWSPLKSVTIPESVTSIGKGAFTCTSLTSITLPKGITCIEAQTFEQCGLTSITIPEGVTEIGVDAFANCHSLASVTIPQNVHTIHNYAFSGCESLTSITIPEGVTSINEYAFSGCSSLTSIKIPDSVSWIGQYAFSSCSSLASVTLPAEFQYIPTGMFYNCTSLTGITIPSMVSKINDYAFCGSGLTSMTMPMSVDSIGEYAFQNCNSLTNVTMPGWIRKMGEYAFAYCDNLTTVVLSEKVKTLGKYAFAYCDNLTSITVPCTLQAWISGNKVLYESNPAIKWSHVASTTTANDTTDTLSLSCTSCTKTYTVTLKAPAKTIYTGKPIEATCTGAEDGFTPVITYSGNNLVNGKPVYKGTYTATISYGDKKVSVQYTITEAPAPAKPNKITNVVSGVHVYWPAVSGASKYGLWRSETGINGTYKWIANPTVAHFTDTKVTSGKTYYYKVTTLDTVNNTHSLKSAAIGITYVSTPDITSRVNQAAGVKLGWNKIVGATGYAIYRKPYSGNSDWVRVATINSPTTLTWTDTSVKTANGSVYKYTIRALAGSNNKTLSGCRGAGRTMVRLSSRTLSSATKASATSIKCSWNTTSQATGYEVRFMVGSTVYKTFTVGNYKTGVKTFAGLKAGQTYKIQVRTYKKVDGVGSFYSAWSTAKTVSL